MFRIATCLRPGRFNLELHATLLQSLSPTIIIYRRTVPSGTSRSLHGHEACPPRWNVPRCEGDHRRSLCPRYCCKVADSPIATHATPSHDPRPRVSRRSVAPRHASAMPAVYAVQSRFRFWLGSVADPGGSQEQGTSTYLGYLSPPCQLRTSK